MHARVSIPAWASSAAALFVASCASAPAPGFSGTPRGRGAHAEFCEGVQAFALASLDVAGRRSAAFLPMGLDPNHIDMQAPMHAEPFDDAATDLYARTGSVTHYVGGAQLGEALSSCFQHGGFERRSFSKSEDVFQATFVGQRRRIEIAARDGTAALLIASEQSAHD